MNMIKNQIYLDLFASDQYLINSRLEKCVPPVFLNHKYPKFGTFNKLHEVLSFVVYI